MEFNGDYPCGYCARLPDLKTFQINVLKLLLLILWLIYSEKKNLCELIIPVFVI